jgi:hypothetical protein
VIGRDEDIPKFLKELADIGYTDVIPVEISFVLSSVMRFNSTGGFLTGTLICPRCNSELTRNTQYAWEHKICPMCGFHQKEGK